MLMRLVPSKKTRRRKLLALLVALSCLAPVFVYAGSPDTAAKERLVLMPLRVPEEDRSLLGAMETALVQGMQQRYEVLSGEPVATKARAIFNAESRASSNKECDETRCMQDIAQAFAAELIASANVTRKEDGFSLFGQEIGIISSVLVIKPTPLSPMSRLESFDFKILETEPFIPAQLYDPREA